MVKLIDCVYLCTPPASKTESPGWTEFNAEKIFGKGKFFTLPYFAASILARLLTLIFGFT